MSDNLALRLERAQVAHATVADELTDLLGAIGLSLSAWDDWHYDPYDGELCITGCAGLTEPQRTALMAHGFRLPRTVAKTTTQT